MLGYILDDVRAAGIREVTLIVGDMGNLVEKYVCENYDFDATFITQNDPKGLGHAVSLGLTEDDKEVLIVLGDTLFEFDLASVLKTKKTSAIGVATVEDARQFGVVEVEDDRVVRLVEKPDKPKSNLVIIGVYLVRNAPRLRRAIKMLFERNLTTRGEFQITDALQLMIEEGETIGTFPIDNWFDCGKVKTLLGTNRYLLEKQPVCQSPPPRDKTILIPPVSIHPSAVTENAIIGPHATVAADAVIKNAMVRDSIVGQGAKIHSVLVEGSLVGNEAEIVGRFHRFNVGDASEILSNAV